MVLMGILSFYFILPGTCTASFSLTQSNPVYVITMHHHLKYRNPRMLQKNHTITIIDLITNHILTQRNLDCCIIAITAIIVLRITTTINVIQSASMAYGILVILAALIL